MSALGSTDDDHLQQPNPVPTAPPGGYRTRPLAGRKRIEDNSDVLDMNVKHPRLSEGQDHAPALRFPCRYPEPEHYDVGGQDRPTATGQRETRSLPRLSMQRSPARRELTERAQIAVAQNVPDTPVQAADEDQFLAHEPIHNSPTGVHVAAENNNVHHQAQSSQHRQLLQQLLQPPSQPQHQALSSQPQQHGQASQNPQQYPLSQEIHHIPPQHYPQQEQGNLPSAQSHQQSPQQLGPPFSAYHYQQPSHNNHNHNRQLPPPPSSQFPQLPPPHYNLQGGQHQEQPLEHPKAQHAEGPQPLPRQQLQSSLTIPQARENATRCVPPGGTQPPDGKVTTYDALLIQLIQRVGYESYGRIMTVNEAFNTWNQMDCAQQLVFHNHVSLALQQVHVHGSSESRVHNTDASDVHQPIIPTTQSEHPHLMHHDGMAVVHEVRNAAEGVTESAIISQGSGLGFCFEQMETDNTEPIDRDAMDCRLDGQAPRSSSTIRATGRENAANTVMHDSEKRNVNLDADYPLGVDGFGLPVDMEDHETNVRPAANGPSVSARRDASPRADSANNPLLLMLMAKFGTLVDALQRQTDAIQSMDAMMRTYVEESRKMLAQGPAASVQPEGNGTLSPGSNIQPPPGLSRKIQDRVAQITGQVIQQSSEVPDKNALKTLKEHVRSHLLTLLGVPSIDLLAKRCPPFTQDEVDAYLADDGSVECTPHSFRIDFQREWKRFAFNKEAREVFIENFTDVMMGSGMVQDDVLPAHLLRRDIIGDILDTYVTGTLRRKYRELLQLNPQPQEGEADEEAKQRVQAAEQKRNEALRKAAQTSRRTTMFVARNVAIAVTPSLQKHSLLFARLTASNMSDDESDGPRKVVPRKFRIIVAEWQSVKLRQFLWEVDRLYRLNWSNTPKPRRRPGNTPRDRALKPDSRSEPGVAAPGLWRNCYDQEWLLTLNGYDRKKLAIIDGDYEFPDTSQTVNNAVNTG